MIGSDTNQLTREISTGHGRKRGGDTEETEGGGGEGGYTSELERDCEQGRLEHVGLLGM